MCDSCPHYPLPKSPCCPKPKPCCPSPCCPQFPSACCPLPPKKCPSDCCKPCKPCSSPCCPPPTCCESSCELPPCYPLNPKIPYPLGCIPAHCCKRRCMVAPSCCPPEVCPAASCTTNKIFPRNCFPCSPTCCNVLNQSCSKALNNIVCTLPTGTLPAITTGCTPSCCLSPCFSPKCLPSCYPTSACCDPCCDLYPFDPSCSSCGPCDPCGAMCAPRGPCRVCPPLPPFIKCPYPVLRPIGYDLHDRVPPVFPCYQVGFTGDQSWNDHGMRILFTEPDVPGNMNFEPCEPLFLTLGVQVQSCRNIVPDTLYAICYTHIYTAENNCGLWKEFLLEYNPALTEEWSDSKIYKFQGAIIPTAKDQFRLNFKVQWHDIIIWAAEY